VRCRADVAVKLQLIRMLAQYGFSCEVRSPGDSWTPLLAAVEQGLLELVKALVELGARLSADRHLGFTPLHLACQMGHWHLLPCLTAAMQGQYARVAAWGPSPQYVSLNLVDAYGRTALDIALLRYFNNPLPSCAQEARPAEEQKAVDILREFVHRTPPKDPGLVCGWELLRVLRFLDALPSKKGAGNQQLFGVEWDGSLLQRDVSEDGMKSRSWRSGSGSSGGRLGSDTPEAAHLGNDTQALLQAARLLVHAGVQTKKLPQDLVQPPAAVPQKPPPSEAEGRAHGADGSGIKEAIASFGGSLRLRRTRGPKYSPIEPDDAGESSADDGL